MVQPWLTLHPASVCPASSRRGKFWLSVSGFIRPPNISSVGHACLSSPEGGGTRRRIGSGSGERRSPPGVSRAWWLAQSSRGHVGPFRGL